MTDPSSSHDSNAAPTPDIPGQRAPPAPHPTGVPHKTGSITTPDTPGQRAPPAPCPTGVSHKTVSTGPFPWRAGLAACLATATLLLVTPASAQTLPAAPTGLAAEPGNARVKLTWDDPSDATITGYEVSTDGGVIFAEITGSNASTTEHTVTGLTNGTAYTFAVRAVSGSNKGPSASITATPVPAAPANLTAEPGHEQVKLTWDDPGDDTITYYEVLIRGGMLGDAPDFQKIENSDANTTEHTVLGLTNGTEYDFRVRAVSGLFSEGQPSAWVTATPIPVPAAPTNLAAGSGNTDPDIYNDGTVVLTWNDPGDSNITGYDVSAVRGTTPNFIAISGSDANTTEHTVTGLTNGREYTFRVRAKNTAGAGISSSVTDTAWPVPGNVKATPDNARVVVEWDRIPDVDRYRIDTTGGGLNAGTQLTGGTGDRRRIAISVREAGVTLTNGIEYTFEVRGISRGTEESQPVTVKATPGVRTPAAPANLAAGAGDTRVRLTWDTPTYTDSTADPTITGYEVSIDDGTGEVPTFEEIPGSNASTTAHTVTGLTNGTAYTFAVRAENASGEGAASDSVTATPLRSGPRVRYTAPSSLKVGMAIDALSVSTSDTIASYTAADLPAGLTIDTSTGEISGTPTTANSNPQTATVTATDTDGNTGTTTIVFPPVAQGDQTLTDFAYDPAEITFGDPPPALTPPSGAQAPVTYAATPEAVCSVDSSTGALTITSGGTCTITATAEATADYLAATTTTDVEVLVTGLTLHVNTIAGDDIINEQENTEGFAITGSTGTRNGVPVEVTIDGTPVGSTISDGNGNWSVNVPSATLSMTQGSMVVVVTATHPDRSATVTVRRVVPVDLTPDLPLPEAVKGFSVEAAVAEESYDLSWEDPEDDTIIRYEYRWHPHASWSEWTEIPASRSDTTSYSVVAAEAGLDLYTAYLFQLRAVNARSPGPPSEDSVNALQVAVSFDAAAYEAEEGGGTVTVAVRLGSPADHELTIPILVTAGTAEPGDYEVEGLDEGMLTFDVGDDTETFTITAADEAESDDDYDDEIVDLGFGALPLGLTAGTPATATLTIIDDEGDVIRSRFRRLNDAILSKHALTLADVTIAAVTSRQAAGPGCADQPNTVSLGGQSSFAELLTTNAERLNTGPLDLKQLLGTSAFRLRLTDDAASGPGCLTLWGQGDYRRLASGNAQALDWAGDLLTGQVGADALLRADLRAGLAMSWSDGDFDYADRTAGTPFSGAYTSRMLSVHPYVTWWSPFGLDFWATGGYGWGKIELDDQEVGSHSSDTTLGLASVGASGPLPLDAALLPGGTTTMRLKAQASVAQMDVAGHGSLLRAQTIAAQRLRLALEGSHERTLASGAQLTPSVEVGLRHDGGAGATGTGLEVGAGLRYVNPALGLTVEGRGRVLAAYAADYEEWGASGLIQVDPGTAGQGLSLSVAPSYGATASGVARLWDQGLEGLGTTPQAAAARLEAVVGYGLRMWAGLLTPYGGVTLANQNRRLRLGGTLAVGPAFNLSLETTQEVQRATPTMYGVLLQTQWRF